MHVSAAVEEPLYSTQPASLHRVGQRRPALVVLWVHVCAAFEERFDHRTLHGARQRCPAAVVLMVRAGLSFKKEIDETAKVGHDSIRQRRRSFVILRLEIDRLLAEQFASHPRPEVVSLLCPYSMPLDCSSTFLFSSVVVLQICIGSCSKLLVDVLS